MNSHPNHFWQMPRSRLGWWAFGLAAGNILLNIISPLLRIIFEKPGNSSQITLVSSGMLMLLLGLAGGVLGVLAVVRRKERSWAVWLAVLVGASMLVLLIGEFAIPH